MTAYRIAVIKGDGIGPEVAQEGMLTLSQVGALFDCQFDFQEVLAGGVAIDEVGQGLPAATIEICQKADSVLLGAVGGPKWDHLPGDKRPEKALLGLRGALGVFANLRPAYLHKPLASACPLKDELVKDGLDLMIVRELTGGIYFGEKGRKQTADGETAYDISPYSVKEIQRIGRIAFEAAKGRRQKVTSVDKANVLETSRLWRQVMMEMAKEYPEITFENMLVDNAAMQLVKDPGQFDVLVTENMFGDILSDEAAMLTGSIGMLPSASLGSGKAGLYEPSHGSAPDIAGQDKANPLATILSVAMMCRYSLDLPQAADSIESAVADVLDAGLRTVDIAQPGTTILGTKAMGDAVRQRLRR